MFLLSVESLQNRVISDYNCPIGILEAQIAANVTVYKTPKAYSNDRLGTIALEGSRRSTAMELAFRILV